jgi:hypothetical protein
MAYSTFNSQEDVKQSSSRQERLKEFLAYHADLINDLGINKGDFTIKREFYDASGRHFVYVFPSEFRKEKGSYFEIVGSNYQPANKDRIVYRIPFNPNFEEEYELCETGAYSGSYIVYLDELRSVNPRALAISGPTDAVLNGRFTSEERVAPGFGRKPLAVNTPPSTMPDESYTNMTIRDFVAIQTGAPVSNKEWLNQLVKSIHQSHH